MSNLSRAKEHIIGRIQKALHNVPDNEKPKDVPIPRNYRRKGKRSPEERATLFIDRLSEYKATVKQVHQNELKETIANSFYNEKIEKIVVPEGFSQNWLPDTISPLFDKPESPLSRQELANADGVISTCALAIAQTGTIILNAGKGQGRRILTLLPDYHLCIVWENQIVELVPEGFACLEPSVRKEKPPITMISGPSATSDIELNRVEGVHGPRRLDVLVVDE